MIERCLDDIPVVSFLLCMRCAKVLGAAIGVFEQPELGPSQHVKLPSSSILASEQSASISVD